jgi:integrase
MSKRKNADGEGSFYKRPNGDFEAKLLIGTTADGKPRYKAFRGKTQGEVQARFLEAKIQIHQGTFSEPNNIMFGEHLYSAYLLELHSGLRRGELLGIRWKDIDLEENTIRVCQQLCKVGNDHVISGLKTESSKRLIAIPL